MALQGIPPQEFLLPGDKRQSKKLLKFYTKRCSSLCGFPAAELQFSTNTVEAKTSLSSPLLQGSEPYSHQETYSTVNLSARTLCSSFAMCLPNNNECH